MFRARPQNTGQVIVVKVGDNRHALARQFRRQRQAFLAMPEGNIPRPYFLDPDLAVMGMQNIPGRSFRSLWSEEAGADLATRAGVWLAAFHRTSLEMRPIDTAPMLRWLGPIARPELPSAHLAGLAKAAEGVPTPHAVIHGDFHAGNLILARDGRTVGFDFQNIKPNLCLRDVFFFLTDAALHGPAPTEAFLAGYGALEHAPAVLRFLDAYLATAAAARAMRSGPVGPRMQARLDVLLPILSGQRGLLAPH